MTVRPREQWRTRARANRPRRGFALMLVLWLIVVLGAITTTIVIRTREASALSGNARARVLGQHVRLLVTDSAVDVEDRMSGERS